MSRPKKKNKKKLNSNTDLLISIANFDTRSPTVRPVYSNVPLQDARHLTFNDYMPSGGTPLNDAVLKFGAELHEAYKAQPNKLHVGLLNDESGSMGYAGLTSHVIEGVNTFLDELKSDDSKGGEPGVIMVIMTDGEENSSVEDRTGDLVKQFIKAREVDGWNFFYLGANQDSWTTGHTIGLGVTSSTFDFAANAGGTRTAYANMARSTNLRKTSSSSEHSLLASAAIPGVKNYVGDEDEEDVGS